MLTKEQNELLCRVGPGTLMGTLFRRYWLPIMHSWELVADGAPIRIRVLGEDLIAFRDTDGINAQAAALRPARSLLEHRHRFRLIPQWSGLQPLWPSVQKAGSVSISRGSPR